MTNRPSADSRSQASRMKGWRPDAEPPAEPTTDSERQSIQLRRMVGDLPEEGEE